MEILPVTEEHFNQVCDVVEPYLSAAVGTPTKAICKGIGYFEDGKLISFILIVPETTYTVSVPLLATRKGYEGNGIMHLLFKSEALRDKSIWLEVHPSNTRARNLYKSLGFDEWINENVTYKDGMPAVMCERKALEAPNDN